MVQWMFNRNDNVSDNHEKVQNTVMKEQNELSKVGVGGKRRNLLFKTPRNESPVAFRVYESSNWLLLDGSWFQQHICIFSCQIKSLDGFCVLFGPMKQLESATETSGTFWNVLPILCFFLVSLLTLFLQLQDDRSLINLHLMHTSYFLFVMVITMFCYAVIKGRPGKVRQTNVDYCPEKVQQYDDTL